MSEHHDAHGFAHVMSPAMLLAVFAALIVLTVLTVVLAGNPNIPSDYEIIVALAIATVKGALVVLFFMHMIYDKPLNAILFVFSLVFVALFLGFAISDTEQYQDQIQEFNYSQDAAG